MVVYHPGLTPDCACRFYQKLPFTCYSLSVKLISQKCNLFLHAMTFKLLALQIMTMLKKMPSTKVGLQRISRVGSHNSSAFIFCAGDCPFKSEPTPTSADACGEVTRCNAGCQEVSRYSTRGGSQGIYITFASAKQVNKAEPTLALKPRGEETSLEIQNRGTSGHRNRTHVSAKNF